MKRRYGWEEVSVGGHNGDKAEISRQKKNGRASHIYLNLSVINSNPGENGLSKPIRANFAESRSTPIIEDASEWDFSVIRFSTNGTGLGLPLWIPQISIGPTQNNVNLTTYTLSICPRGGPAGGYPATLLWDPEIKDTTIAPLPQPPNVSQDLSSSYYFGKTFDHFATIWNTAFQTAAAAYAAAVGMAAADLTTCYLSYAKGIGFSLTLSPQFQSTAATLTAPATMPPIILQMNVPLANLLNSFNFNYINPTQNATYSTYNLESADFTLIMPQTGPLALYGPVADRPNVVVTPFASCTDSGLWNAVDSFVFTTNFLPLIPEQGTAPVLVDESNVGDASSLTQGGFTSILSDLVVPGEPVDALSATYYVPPSEYRISSMTANVPVQNIDVSLFWKYRLTGQLIPVYMTNNSSISMKMMFRRKDWTAYGGP